MENFSFYNPTKILFGKGVISELGLSLKKYGKKVLFVYGQGSIKQNGIYQQVVSELNQNKIEFVEFSGIRPNPIIEDVYEAITLGKLEKVDVILAVGGGSVIDSAKMIASGIPVTEDVWNYFTETSTPSKTLPLLTILTLAATGSEMNSFAVIQNNNTLQKIGFGHPLLFPKESFLDPEYTFSVSKHQTACGIADIIAHCLEYWFGNGSSPLIDAFIISIIHEIKEISIPLLNDLKNYDLRSRMLLASTLSLNGVTSMGKTSADWGAHNIGHSLSVMYDISHGESLSIVYPAWLKTIPKQNDERLILFSKYLFIAPTIEESISSFETFLKDIGLSINLSQLDLLSEEKPNIIHRLIINNTNGLKYEINNEDITNITCKML